MFIKMAFPAASFYFMESRPWPLLGNVSLGGVTRADGHPWAALVWVLCAHLAVFAALRPQAQPLSEQTTIPEPITVSWLSASQLTPPQPMPRTKPIEKAQKPARKPVKTPVNKPVVPRVKQDSRPVVPSTQQTAASVAATSPSTVEPKADTTNNKPVLNVAEVPTPYQSPSFNAAYLNNSAPDYPSVSRRLGEQGLVLLRVQVTADGIVGFVELQTGSGSTRLDQAALAAVKQWRFIPAKRGDQPVSASVVVPVRFSIEG